MSAASANHGGVITLLHGAGANLLLKDMTGSTVAHMAASCNIVQSLLAIFECYGDPSILSVQAHNGATPAHVASSFDNAEVCTSIGHKSKRRRFQNTYCLRARSRLRQCCCCNRDACYNRDAAAIF